MSKAHNSKIRVLYDAHKKAIAYIVKRIWVQCSKKSRRNGELSNFDAVVYQKVRSRPIFVAYLLYRYSRECEYYEYTKK